MQTPRTSTPLFGGLRRRTPSFGILTTYPPTACGIATFSAALGKGLAANDAEVSIVRVADGLACASKAVIGELENGSARSVANSVELLNRSDVAIVQHEYGLYGGADGDEVLDVLAGLQVPSIVIAHTILSNPTPHQKAVLEAVASMADQVVVMSQAAQSRLRNRFDVDPAIVSTICHGAAIPTRRAIARPFRPADDLDLGPDRTRQRHRAGDRRHGVDGPSRLAPRYLVAGQTHPRVRAADGEAYRNARIEQASRNGVSDSVLFDATYRDVDSLTALIQSCSVVVLPYDTKDQVTSGVLVDAIAAGRPVIATAFPHAVEMLASGAGIVVDHDDPAVLVDALRRVLVEPGLADAMAAEASRLAPAMGWPVVAGAYLRLADRLLSKHPALV